MRPNPAPLERLLIATDAWQPQTNGVVQTLSSLIAELGRRGVTTKVISPADFPCVPLPTYADIPLAITNARTVSDQIASFRPDHLHIATEGPVGWAARRAARDLGRPFTTSYHTRFPEYVRQRAPVPIELSYAVLRHFHSAAAATMVSTRSLETELAGHGFRNLVRWGRGVDIARFRPDAAATIRHEWPRPVFLYVGRLAPEKSVDAFLSLNLPGTKVVVGDGPSAPMLRDRFRQAVFLGNRDHDELPAIYAEADVFVFPSRTDTFGLVLIEALASGLPVAAFPVPGPLDVLGSSAAGVMSEDLRMAAMAALRIDRQVCREHALQFTWKTSADQFLANSEHVRASLMGQNRLTA